MALQEVVEEDSDAKDTTNDDGSENEKTGPGAVDSVTVSCEGSCGGRGIHGEVFAGFHRERFRKTTLIVIWNKKIRIYIENQFYTQYVNLILKTTGRYQYQFLTVVMVYGSMVDGCVLRYDEWLPICVIQQTRDDDEPQKKR